MLSADQLDSIAVLSPVEINEASMRQLSPIDRLDRKEFSTSSPPIPHPHSMDPDFFSFSNGSSALPNYADYSLDTFLSLPFSEDEVLEEAGDISFEQFDAGLNENILPTSTKKEPASFQSPEKPEPDIDSESTLSSETITIQVDHQEKKIVRKKVYQCFEKGCDAWFVRASRFHEHIMSHNNARPFHCSMCTYQTKWKSDVKKHIRKQVTKGDMTHTNAQLVVARDYDKDKLKAYNIFHVEKLIYCVEGTNKVAELGTSRDFFRDPSEPEPPPPEVPADPPGNNGKLKKKKSSSKKRKIDDNTAEAVQLSAPTPTLIQSQEIVLEQQKSSVSTLNLPTLESLLGIGHAQISDSDPILSRQILPAPAEEFIHLVGFNRY